MAERAVPDREAARGSRISLARFDELMNGKHPTREEMNAIILQAAEFRIRLEDARRRREKLGVGRRSRRMYIRAARFRALLLGREPTRDELAILLSHAAEIRVMRAENRLPREARRR